MTLDRWGRITTLEERTDFVRVQRQGRKYVGRSCLLLVHPGPSEAPRVGFTISRKVGNAVTRNRVRRRLREIVRSHADVFCPNNDHVFIVRVQAVSATFVALQKEVECLLKEAKRAASPNAF